MKQLKAAISLICITLMIVLFWNITSMERLINSLSCVSEDLHVTVDERTHQRIYPQYRSPGRSDLLVQRNKCPGSHHPPSYFGLSPTYMMLNEDDKIYGKSCAWISNVAPFTNETQMPPKHKYPHWQCRDCGTGCSYSTYNDCPIITSTSQSPCIIIDRNPWIDPVSIQHQSFSSSNAHYEYASQPYILNNDEKNPTIYLERLPCQNNLNDPECFDLTLCDPTQPMKVYLYGGAIINYSQAILQQHPHLYHLVTDPSQACLKVVACDIFCPDTPREFRRMPGRRQGNVSALLTKPSWEEGRNHFIWKSYRCFRDHSDGILARGINFQRAAISMPNLNRMTTRQGYDVPIPFYTRNQQDEFHVKREIVENLDLEKPRKWLLFFKGSILHDYHVWGYHHRWLAAEYWDPTPGDVLVETVCHTDDKYERLVGDYADYLLNSTFSFCPGGISQGTYRFHEALSLGSIPVVTNDFIAPFEPELNWNHCLIRVSEARIIDIPRLLRDMFSSNHTMIVQRRKHCHDLFRTMMGWTKKNKEDSNNHQDVVTVDHGQQGFELAMKIWASRIKLAFAKLEDGQELMKP